MDNDALAERIVRTLRGASPRPLCAHLFGSRARGDARADSDVDVAVMLGDDVPATLATSGAHFASELEAVLELPVDVVVLERAPPDLVHRVLRDGVLLFDDDPSARVRFEVAARNAYFDLLPYLREYRRGGVPAAS